MTYDEMEALKNDERFTDEEKEAIANCSDTSKEWGEDDCATVCKLADMLDEWESADGDSFEAVVFAALDKLGY